MEDNKGTGEDGIDFHWVVCTLKKALMMSCKKPTHRPTGALQEIPAAGHVKGQP
jgi:hypothetical protein